jgi:hypothetical protein
VIKLYDKYQFTSSNKKEGINVNVLATQYFNFEPSLLKAAASLLLAAAFLCLGVKQALKTHIQTKTSDSTTRSFAVELREAFWVCVAIVGTVVSGVLCLGFIGWLKLVGV